MRGWRAKAAIGIGVGVVLTVVVAAFAGMWLMNAWRGMALDRAVYDAVSVGQSKTELDRLIPHGGARILARYRQQGPPRPRGASCRHFLSKDEHGRPHGPVVYRFCFSGGVVVEKRRFEAGNSLQSS